MYFTMVKFLPEAISITNRRLGEIENPNPLAENKEAKRQEQITRLGDDLLWHAKSFALRLMIDAASVEDHEYHRSRRIILRQLAQDKKFYKLADTAVREILPYYKGRELLR